MKDENYILFDQYLQGELSDAEKLSFENQLKADSDLAFSFETFKEVNNQLENKFGLEAERKVFKENLVSIANSKSKNAIKYKVIVFKPWHYSVAASVVLLFGLFFMMQNSKPAFEDYNQHENAYFVERGDLSENIKMAQEDFNAKKYDEATVQFQIILKEKSTPEMELYYGISLLEINRLKQAERVFNELATGPSIYKNKAMWNLALLKLKQKDYEACESLLKQIPKDFENYDKVEELLDKLD